jgi:hypothetical protein
MAKDGRYCSYFVMLTLADFYYITPRATPRGQWESEELQILSNQTRQGLYTDSDWSESKSIK